MAAAADKVYDTLPRPLKRLSALNVVMRARSFLIIPLNFAAFFEGLAGADADIDAVSTDGNTKN
jgi:hypothetical protein